MVRESVVFALVTGLMSSRSASAAGSETASLAIGVDNNSEDVTSGINCVDNVQVI